MEKECEKKSGKCYIILRKKILSICSAKKINVFVLRISRIKSVFYKMIWTLKENCVEEWVFFVKFTLNFNQLVKSDCMQSDREPNRMQPNYFRSLVERDGQWRRLGDQRNGRMVGRLVGWFGRPPHPFARSQKIISLG